MRHLFLILIIGLTLSGCSQPQNYRRCTGAVWGTTYHITYKADRDLCDSIVETMHQVDLSLSPFTRGSLISEINAGADVAVDNMLRDVMEISKQVHTLSHGYFDPTVAPLVNLWGFGFAPGASDRPTNDQIEEALASVGIDSCHIDSLGHVIRKSSTTQFDFSAVAKGYGVDCIARTLRRCGCTDYMVEVGGEIALSGLSPSGTEWRIQVDAPEITDASGVSHTPLRIIKLTDAAIATSGNYRNRRTTSEGEVAHTISPLTGMPIQTSTLSATVVAETSALADALATALMAMPDSDAVAMAQSINGVHTMIVRQSDDGDYALIFTGDFRNFIEN